MLGEHFAYGAFVLLGLVGPGLAIQRALGLPLDAALVLPLGSALTAMAFWMSCASHQPVLYPVLVAGALLSLSLDRRRWRWAKGPSLVGALPPFLAVLFFLAASEYRFDRLAPAGSFLADPVESVDTTLHVGMAWELAHAYPAQVPGFSGEGLHYHYGQDLVRAAATRWAHIPPYDLLARLDLTLSALALVLALRSLTAALGGSLWAVALAGWSPLAADLSFLLAGFHGATWWANLLDANLVFYLSFGNSLVLALALCSGALVAWHRFETEGDRGWLAVSALLGLAVPFFKSFLALPHIAGLAYAWVRQRRRELLVAVAPCLIATALLSTGVAGHRVAVFLEPFVPALRTAETLGLLPLSGWRLAGWVSSWVVAAVGLRALGVPLAFRALRTGTTAAQALAVAALSGWPLGLLVRMGFRDEEVPYNTAYYFIAQSAALLWVFAALAAPQPSSRLKRAGAVMAFGALTLPSTIQFAWKKAHVEPVEIPAKVVRAMTRLEETSRPDSVVIEAPWSRFPPASLVLAGRRLAYTSYIPYLDQFVAADRLGRRRGLIEEFFATSDPQRGRAIIRELGADYVFLFATARIHFDPTGILEPVYVEQNARLYRVALRDGSPKA